MPPWQEIQYFQTPNVIYTPLTLSGPWTQVAPGNPNRVALLLSCSGQATFSPDSSIPIQTGMVMGQYQTILLMTEKEYGNLISQTWYGSTFEAGGTPWAVAIEVILRDWPQ